MRVSPVYAAVALKRTQHPSEIGGLTGERKKVHTAAAPEQIAKGPTNAGDQREIHYAIKPP